MILSRPSNGQTPIGEDQPDSIEADTAMAAVELFAHCYAEQTGEPLPEGTTEWLYDALNSMGLDGANGCDELAAELDEAIALVPPPSEGALPDTDQLLSGQQAFDLEGVIPDLGWAELCAVLDQGAELSGDQVAEVAELDRILEGQLAELTSGGPCDIAPESLEHCVASLRQMVCQQGAENLVITDDAALVGLEGCDALQQCQNPE